MPTAASRVFDRVWNGSLRKCSDRRPTGHASTTSPCHPVSSPAELVQQKLPNILLLAEGFIRPDLDESFTRWITGRGKSLMSHHVCGGTTKRRMLLTSSLGKPFYLRETDRRIATEQARQPAQSLQSVRRRHSFASKKPTRTTGSEGWAMLAPVDQRGIPAPISWLARSPPDEYDRY